MQTKHLSLALVAGALVAACNNQSPVAANNAAPTLQAIKQIACGKTPHGMGAAGGFIYNANTGDGTITVVNGADDSVAGTLTLPNGGVPGTVAAFPDGKNVLAFDTKNNTVMVIDPAQNHKILQNFQLAQTPSNMAIDDDNMNVLVTTTGNQAYVLTFDAADRARAPTVKSFAVGNSNAEDRAAGYSGDFGAVPSNGDNNVQLINMATGEVKTVSDGNQPTPVAIGKSDDKGVVAIVGNFASQTITFYQLPNGDKKTISGVGLSPEDIALDSDLHRAYLTMSGSNVVTVVDYLEESLVGQVQVGSVPVHIEEAPVLPGATADAAASPAKYTLKHNGAADAPLSHELWVGNDKGGSVTVFDGDSLRVKATVTTGKGHHKLAFWGTKAYASNITDNTISVIDRTVIR